MTKSVEETLREEWDLLKKSGLLSQIGCTAGPKKNKGIYNMLHWNALIRGPKNSPYNGYMFKFEINFPENYPNSPPKVTCKTNIYHMNISENGDVCVSSIKDNNKWKTAKDISTVLLSIFIIFSKPNPNSPYRGEIAQLYTSDYEQYEKNVKEYCDKYAIKIPDT